MSLPSSDRVLLAHISCISSPLLPFLIRPTLIILLLITRNLSHLVIEIVGHFFVLFFKFFFDVEALEVEVFAHIKPRGVLARPIFNLSVEEKLVDCSFLSLLLNTLHIPTINRARRHLAHESYEFFDIVGIAVLINEVRRLLLLLLSALILSKRLFLSALVRFLAGRLIL